jgi:hypothetical protein
VQYSSGVQGLMVDIVMQHTAAAKAGFHQIDRLIAKLPWVTKVKWVRERPATAHIGQATRLFTNKAVDQECGDLGHMTRDDGRTCTTDRYTADVVVIGMVV